MRRNATRKFFADSTVLAVGLITSLITARQLGPSGRGVFSTVGFVASFAGAVAVLGLGEALIIAIGRRRASLREGIGTVLVAVALSSLLFGVLTFIVAVLLAGDEPHAALIGLLAAAAVPAAAITTVLSYGQNAEERFGIPILSVVVMSVATCGLMAVMLLVLHAGIAGAFGALLGGSIVGLILLTASSARDHLLRWSLDLGLLRAMLPTGVRLAASSSMIGLTARLDLVFVFLLAGKAPAGQYSIALTVSSLAGSAAAAITYASFPQVAYADQPRWLGLSDRLMQSTIATSVVGTVVLAATSPLLIPALFGARFQAAVVPTLILLAGAVVSSMQWTLGRLTSARGHPNVPLRAYAASLVVMCAGDVALIPPLGASGAAVAVLLSCVVGLFVTVRGARVLGPDFPRPSLQPRFEAFRELPDMVLGVLRRTGGRRATQPGVAGVSRTPPPPA